VLQLPCQKTANDAPGGLCGAVVKGQTKGQMIVAAVAAAFTCSRSYTWRNANGPTEREHWDLPMNEELLALARWFYWH